MKLFSRFTLLSLLCFMFLSFPFVSQINADPPVLPPTPPPEIPCAPLVCLQLTDAVEVAPETWRFEFRSLNWTAFTDRPCPASDPTCVDRTSPGAPATGLVFVRSAALSTVDFTVLPIDPNGAPLGVEPIMIDDRKLIMDFHSAPDIDILVERSINHSRALHALRLFESAGVPCVNSHQVSQICGDKLLTTAALKDNGVAQPECRVAFTEESALDAIEDLRRGVPDARPAVSPLGPAQAVLPARSGGR